MQPKSAALLWGARRAAELIGSFVTDRTWSDYRADPMLRSAVERQFEIIGESLNRLSRVDPETADRVEDLPRIVAFRNVLVHGYATIDDAIVWEVATDRLPVGRTLSAKRNVFTANPAMSKPRSLIGSSLRILRVGQWPPK